MLHFEEYGDFADYFGRRWHFYLSDIIASIPVPWRFAKGDFESGLAAKVLRGFAEDLFAVLSKEEKAQMTAAHSICRNRAIFLKSRAISYPDC